MSRPLHDHYEPPARGKVELQRHWGNKRKMALEKRTKWRDEVLQYKKEMQDNKDSDL